MHRQAQPKGVPVPLTSVHSFMPACSSQPCVYSLAPNAQRPRYVWGATGQDVQINGFKIWLFSAAHFGCSGFTINRCCREENNCFSCHRAYRIVAYRTGWFLFATVMRRYDRWMLWMDGWIVLKFLMSKLRLLTGYLLDRQAGLRVAREKRRLVCFTVRWSHCIKALVMCFPGGWS